MSNPFRWLIVLALLFVGTHIVRSEPASKTKPKYRAYECREGWISCEIPHDWDLIRDQHEEARTHCYGAYFYGPPEDSGISPTASVRFFAPDNVYFANADAYLNRQLRPGLVIPQGEETSAVREMNLDGRPARAFTRDTFEFFPPDSLDTKRIPIRKEHFVVSHRGGFVVVIFSAPTDSVERWQPALEHLLKTIKLLPPPRNKDHSSAR